MKTSSLPRVVDELKNILASFRGLEVLTREHPAGSFPASKAMVPLNFAFEDAVQTIKQLDPAQREVLPGFTIRWLEIALEGYQGIEELCREYLDEGRPVSQVLKPMNDWAEKIVTNIPESGASPGGNGRVIDFDKHR